MTESPPEHSPAPALPAYSANQLGGERARLAAMLRERLWAAPTLRWPAWIDARPGRLGAIVGDFIDPPLGQARAHLLLHHGALVQEGLGALGLALAAPRLAIVADAEQVPRLSRELAGTSIEVHKRKPVFPAQPAQSVPEISGAPWVVPAETLAAVGALLRGKTPPRPCSLAGAVKTPQVFELTGGETPRRLVERARGAQHIAWVALRNSPLSSEPCPADEPLPEGTSLLYILPAGHALLRRRRAAMQPRARATCLACRMCTDFCPQAPNGTAPHRVLHALATQELRPADAAAAGGCTGCGACSVVCPAELLPGALSFELGRAIAEAQPVRAEADEPPAPEAESRLPLWLALRRLDLHRYAGTPG